jgi:hypothetical protein
VRDVFSVTIPIDQFGKSEQFLTSFQNLILNDISSRHFDHFWQFHGIGQFKMIVDKYGDYVRKFMWQLCGCG